MKLQSGLIVLTVVNLGLTTLTLTRAHPVAADTVPAVLRGRALEIVDEGGHVRASLKVYPADPKVKMPDGTTGYPETVLLRLINSEGRPNIKIDASDLGAGVMVGGESNPTYGLLSARGAMTSIKLIDSNERQQTIKP